MSLKPLSFCRVAGAAALLALAGCSSQVVPVAEIGLRNPTATLAGTTRFNVGDFAGEWVTVRCLGQCAPSVRYVVATDGVFVRETSTARTPYTQSAPGILREMGGDGILVVMWVDEGFRTAAVGDADGRWAAILDRRATSSPDRIRAAEEILDFNGWDVSRIAPVPK
ncbi:MAG: lipocalin [Sulfitobacter sp.]